MRCSRYLLVFALMCLAQVFSAQQIPNSFRWPLDRTPVFTGNYGELRPNHFHAGLDFITSPTERLPIYAVENGYVSRIKISPYGYGKVLYITHPNGYVTVYAHQDHFNWKIGKYVREQQYARHTFEIELFPQPSELPVKKGDLIGYTGNSGGSTGPHLHFEIRDEKSEVPLNPLLFYKIDDSTPPVMTELALYDMTDTTAPALKQVLPVKSTKSGLQLLKDSITLWTGNLAFGFAGYDKNSPKGNANNVYEMRLQWDGRLMYLHQLNNIAFDHGRYVNVFSERAGNARIQKCFTPRNNQLKVYVQASNGGKIHFSDTLYHEVIMTLRDEQGNSNTLKFWVRSKSLSNYATPAGPGDRVDCLKEFRKEIPGFSVVIPAGALYNDLRISVDKMASTKGFSTQYSIIPRYTPIDKAIDIKMTYPPALEKWKDKLLLLNNGSSIGGLADKGMIRAESKNFGTFAIGIDTIPPRVHPLLASKKGKNISTLKQLSFHVTDDLSGINTYQFFVNNVWTLAEYDAKTSTITWYLEEQTPSGKLELRLEVLDFRRNTGVCTLQVLR